MQTSTWDISEGIYNTSNITATYTHALDDFLSTGTNTSSPGKTQHNKNITPNPTDTITILQWNIQAFHTKRSLLQVARLRERFDVVLLQKTFAQDTYNFGVKGY